MEFCDNGNNLGCTNCIVSPTYECVGGSPTSLDTCTLTTSTCGNLRLDPLEQCDSLTGCLLCKTISGYQCNNNICKEICGDGLVVGIEQCDDKNTVDGDGCSSQCQLEPMYTCANNACTITCGDGNK